MKGAWISIGEASAIMGVTSATIRSWESRYGWPRPVRTAGSHRRYHRDSLGCFRRVAALRREMPIGRVIEHLGLSE